MLKIICVQLLIICLLICNQKSSRIEALHKYPLRKFSVKFQDASKLMDRVLMEKNHRKLQQEQRRKKEETRRREEEEERRRRRKEEEQRKLQKIEELERKVIEEYLLRKMTSKTTVLKDFYSRF
jgi:hypothetical protein